MDRRRRLLVAALLAAPWRTGWAATSSRPRPLAATLGQLFAHPQSAAAIGRAYLQAYPREAGFLPRLLQLRHPGLWALLRKGGRRDALTERLGEARRQDFAAGAVVSLDGWHLARTEARLCALAALELGSAPSLPRPSSRG